MHWNKAQFTGQHHHNCTGSRSQVSIAQYFVTCLQGYWAFGQLINCEIILDFSFSSSLTFCWVSYWNILHTCLFVTMMPKISNEFICRDFFWFSLSTARCPTDCPPWCAQCPAGVPPLCPPFWLRPMICQHTRSRICFPPPPNLLSRSSQIKMQFRRFQLSTWGPGTALFLKLVGNSS